MTRVRTTHLVWWRLHRFLTTMLTIVGMAILFIAGCDPATAVLPDEENGYGIEEEFDPGDIAERFYNGDNEAMREVQNEDELMQVVG